MQTGYAGAENRASEPRKGTPEVTLDQAEFRRRFLSAFQDLAFGGLASELERVASAAWDAYSHHCKSPRTRAAGEDFHDPQYKLAVDWSAAREEIMAAQRWHDDPLGPARILLISGSSRSEHTCPGEMSKTWRLTQIAKETLSEVSDLVVEELELHRVAAEYDRQIHPCKACFSTAPPLCHWPCSCYPNYSLGQTHDWMNEIYPMWVEAHGIMIVTPVNWYQVSSPVKLMMDRLVCADGGNPDPTLTQGKNAALAKKLELRGWDYPRHLAGRLYAVIAHGDAEGAENVRRSLSDWLSSMHLVSAGRRAELDRYIGYYKPYALNHEELDADEDLKIEIRNAARTLLDAVIAKRSGKMIEAGEDLREPRDK
ncbi:MAG: flavodoxin family protein [Hyphomicrobiales bacterium]|nr:flavodoxin family protein [Hyphomicrobiales bacterium]